MIDIELPLGLLPRKEAGKPEASVNYRKAGRRAAYFLPVLVFMSALPLGAQNSILFGNPIVFPGLRSKGFLIQTSVQQTATTSTITYTVTPPANYIYNADTMVGQVNTQVLLPPNTQISVNFTITYTGWANVIGEPSGGLIAGGQDVGPSPQLQTVAVGPGTGLISFFLSGSSLNNPQPIPPSSITITANLGNPQGGRKGYLNDYTGGGKTNYALWRPVDATWYVAPITAPDSMTPWGIPGDVPVPGDYDGDGITDFAVWRPSQGAWFVIFSSTGQQVMTQWGLPGDFPIVGDYDGDGKTDYAIWRPSEGIWYVKLSSTGAQVVQPFGLPGDIPLSGNFDGLSGKTNYVVWRPSNLNWYVYSTSTGAVTSRPWGLPGDIPVPGDFDGDGKTDFAVWRPSNGNWYVTLSSTGAQVVEHWGIPGDIPISGDFDGDGKADFAIWRPSEGTWYIIYSRTSEQVIQPWGLDGDIPDGRTATSAPTVE